MCYDLLCLHKQWFVSAHSSLNVVYDIIPTVDSQKMQRPLNSFIHRVRRCIVSGAWNHRHLTLVCINYFKLRTWHRKTLCKMDAARGVVLFECPLWGPCHRPHLNSSTPSQTIVYKGTACPNILIISLWIFIGSSPFLTTSSIILSIFQSIYDIHFKHLINNTLTDRFGNSRCSHEVWTLQYTTNVSSTTWC